MRTTNANKLSEFCISLTFSIETSDCKSSKLSSRSFNSGNIESWSTEFDKHSSLFLLWCRYIIQNMDEAAAALVCVFACSSTAKAANGFTIPTSFTVISSERSLY